jgi:radical SAM superfamily enzyme YgiQ (UPF0313 family)
MKILLFQPPVQDFYDTDIRLQPLGICMLKAVVRKSFPDVDVLVRDYHQGYGRRTIALPPELSYLDAYYHHPDSSPFSMFHKYYHFGAAFEHIGSDVAKERPDLVGISSLFSPYYREALTCAREIKTRLKVPVVMGGSHVSASPLSILNDHNVDFIIRGEGERPFVEFLKALRSGSSFEGVPNLGFKRDGELMMNPMEENYPLDELPPADFSDLPRNRYLFGKSPLCFLTTSRGCPHRCTFCSVHLTFGHEFRRRSPENVLSEIKERYAVGYRVFDFEDDNLTFHKQDFRKLLTWITAAFPAGDVRLLAMNGISYHSLDKDVLYLMKLAGFRHLNISLVSAEDMSLLKVQRPHTLRKYLDVVKHAHSLGFDIVSYQILGLPFETLDTMIDTLALMARLPVLIGVSIFYLTPGSPIAGDFPGLSETDTFKARSTAMAIETDHFSRDDLYTLFITARIINFLKGLAPGKRTVTLKEALGAAANLGKRGRIGAEILFRLLEEEQRLHAATKEGLKPLTRFKSNLFLSVLKKAGSIQTREGPEIDMRGRQIP